MNEFERKIWTDDNLTAFVVVLAVVFVAGGVSLLGWVLHLLGAFDSVKALLWGR